MRFLILTCCLFHTLFAIGINDVVKLSLNNTYQLESKRHIVESAIANKRGGYYLFAPSATVGYTYNYRSPQNSPSFSSNTFNVTGNLNLFRGLSDFNSYKKLKLDVDVAKNDLNISKNDIALSTKLTYIKILENKESLKIAKDSIKLLEIQQAQATQFYVHGISDKSAVLSVEVNLANAKIDLSRVQIELVYNLDILQKLSGVLFNADELDDVLVNEDINFDKMQLLNQIYNNNLNIQAIKLSLAKNTLDRKIANSLYYPSIDISASKFWYVTGADTSIINTGLQSQIRFDVTWNIFNGYKAFFDSQSKRALFLSLNSELSDLQKDIDTQLENLLNNLKVSKEQLNLAKLALTQAEENYRIVNNRYQQNIANYIELLNAELLLTNAKSQLITARYEIAANIARIEHLKSEYMN